jgi:monofunctional biosynthetic peptidoglycan transglycosylase
MKKLKAKRRPGRLGFKPRRFLVRWGIKLLILMMLVSAGQVAIVRIVDPPFTMRMVWDYASCRLRSAPYQSPLYFWRALTKISPSLQKAVLAGEDQRFLDHSGFDTIEIRNAFNELVSEHRIRGASTISMQTARTVYLMPSRSFWRKGLEAYYTALIELLWSKKRILEVYLNTVDWGPDIMGAEAAARYYFNKPSGYLSSRQAALLAAILPNPHRLSPLEPSKSVRLRVRRILKDMPHMPRL